VNGSGAPHLDVIDALDGLARLSRRSPTLDGSVPLRVAQGCVPLLDGNAAGLQLRLGLAWRVYRTLGVWRVAPLLDHESSNGWGLPLPTDRDARRHDAFDRLLRARWQTLVARGALPPTSAWRGLSAVVSVASGLRGAIVRVATGLLVRPAPGLVVRVSRCANRGPWSLDVAETVVADSTRHTPLVLECRVSHDVDELRLDGDLATLALAPADVTWHRRALDDRPEVAAAHRAFYDPAYFAAKRAGEVTRKYRRMIGDDAPATGDATLTTPELVEAGPMQSSFEHTARVADVTGSREAPSPCAAVTFFNEVAFTARFDGERVALSWDRDALDRRAAAIAQRWGPHADESDRGALWYLTKYFTPHPAGEPHFFVKPAAFVVTPAGWSSVLEGLSGAGYEVLRGVVHTDRFHATPAVFALHGDRAIHVAAGAPLLRVFPTPAELTAPTFTLRRFEEAHPP
jgi:hypothetical protein